ncbi:pyridoxamine 5'-phosphate oxidase family protein [soil metagenome]
MARAKNKKPSRNSEQKKLVKLIRGIDLCMMTTHGSNDALHARPMSNNGEVEFDGDAWFFTWLWLEELGRWFEDGPTDPEVVLIHVKAKRAQWWSYKGEGDVRL